MTASAACVSVHEAAPLERDAGPRDRCPRGERGRQPRGRLGERPQCGQLALPEAAAVRAALPGLGEAARSELRRVSGRPDPVPVPGGSTSASPRAGAEQYSRASQQAEAHQRSRDVRLRARSAAPRAARAAARSRPPGPPPRRAAGGARTAPRACCLPRPPTGPRRAGSRTAPAASGQGQRLDLGDHASNLRRGPDARRRGRTCEHARVADDFEALGCSRTWPASASAKPGWPSCATSARRECRTTSCAGRGAQPARARSPSSSRCPRADERLHHGGGGRALGPRARVPRAAEPRHRDARARAGCARVRRRRRAPGHECAPGSARPGCRTRASSRSRACSGTEPRTSPRPSSTVFGSAFICAPGDTEYDLVRRYAEETRSCLPLSSRLGQALRHHLRRGVRQVAVGESERASGRLPGAADQTVAFADLTGFTRLGESVDASSSARWRSASPSWPATSPSRPCGS